MDCEKFDQHVIDALYDELDELTHAALKRHMEGCARCAGVFAGLRATRDVGILPVVEPPDDLEARILDAATQAQKVVPLRKRVLRGLAWAGSHAMRPQLAMAALFFLVIGSSLLLLRARPGTLGPVAVSENGAPAPEAPADAQRAQAAAPAATAAPAEVAAADEGDRGAERRAKADGESGTRGGGDDARAALAAALAVRDGAGCAAAVTKLDEVAARFAGTQAAADAMWAEASCFKQMGDRARAQQLYLALRSTGYRDRAQLELAADDANGNVQNQQAARAAPAAAPPPAAATAAAEASLDGRQAVGAPAGAKAAKRPAPPGAGNAGKARPSPAKAAGFTP